MNNESKRKILYLITKSNFGGAQRYVFDLATNAQKNGYDVAVVLGGDGVLKDKLAEEKIKTIQLPELKRDVSFSSDIKNLFSLIKIFKKEKPEIIHLNSSKMGLLGSLAGRIYNIGKSDKAKIIFTGHGWAFNEDRSWISRKSILFLHWLTILFCHKVIAVSEKTKRDISNLPLVSKKIEVIRNGISDIEFKDGFEARQLLGGNIDQSLWIGSIAELHKNKGLDYLIKAFSENAFDYPDAALVIIGEGEERSNLERLIQKLNLTNRVFLLGNKENAKIYLKAFDIFALISRTEALPYVILEAGLAKLPVIASKVGGIPEIIENMKTGLLTEAGNINQIKDKIQLLLERSDLRENLGSSLREKILVEFTKENHLKKTFNIYKLKTKNMSEVEFEENQFQQYEYSKINREVDDTPWMIRFMIKREWISEVKQGYYILGAIVVLCIGLTIYFTLQNPSFRRSSNKKTYIEDIPDEVKARLPEEFLKTLPSRKK